MRKLKLLALAFVFGTASLFATNGTPEIAKKELRTQIVELLDSPQFTLENEINLAITFTFNSEGEIVVLDVNSRHPDVLDYVREHLNGKAITNPGERDKLYTMPLKMQVI